MIRTSWRHYLAAALAALTCCGTAVTVGPAALAAAAGQPGAGKLGPDLIVNPGAQSGAYSVRGWDAVTIPGWQIVTGLPTVVRYGTPRFPSATGRPPELRSGQLFAGGAGGTARLRQVVALRSAAGTVPTPGTAFRLSAWLGGDKHSRASVAVTFRSAAGRVLGRAAVGPHGGTTSAVVISPFARSGVIPAGSASATIELTLATSLTNVDGPYAPYVGYDRAVADNVQFSVAAPVRRAVLTAPAAHVPRYRHVFLFYFENEDYTDVIGNTRQAPFINSLLPHASVLADFFAEEHPSDGNYLALAGGSTFGIPLDDPLEENSQYTIRAPNIGNLIDTAHETWKAYLQSADGPCDDTVHGYYWDDDMPMTYFADVRERPAYCSQHLVPLQSLQTDLASAATTPNFAWVSPNDCTDMEGCGIRSGDDFLKAELGQIMRSPAWRHQRSLAIITFDEDATDNQHPAQRVPTIVIGSAGVRPGYVSRVRYTHYSLLRTIEAVLGLGTLTPNDRYAQPVNDVFRQGEADVWTQSAAVPAVVSRVRASQVPAGASVPAAGHGPADQTAFVVNSASNSVTPVNLVTSRAGKPVPVGGNPQAIALSPDGGTAYVVNSGSGTVTPINTATRRAGPAIRVGADPQAIAITPDGRTAYVLDWGGGSVTPVRIASSRAGPPVRVGSYPFAVSVAPDGRVAYVASYGSDTVTAIDAVTGRKAGPPVSAGQAPDALAVTPDSRAVYAVGGDSDTVTEISAATGGAGQPVPVGYSPTAVAISRSGRWVLVANTISGTVTPVGVATGRAASPISVGAYSYPTAIALAASGPLAVVVDTYSGQVTLINTSTLKSAGTVTVGNYPVAAVIAP